MTKSPPWRPKYYKANRNMKLKIKKNDQVIILSGKDKGRQGKVLQVWPKKGTVLVDGINIVKKHRKKTLDQPGQIISMPKPLPVCKVAVIDPKTKTASRIGYLVNKQGRKQRISKKSQALLD